MDFLRTRWYVAGWSDDVGDQLLARRILGEHVVLFRDAEGRVAALEDRCPHRFAPLHLGRLEKGLVECGYHGLRFDGSGACVLNPHGNHVIPKACIVRSYPLVERHGVLWIWMGDPVAADPLAIPDFSYLVAPDRKTIRGSTLVRANYELINDNLMDASHTQYVHADLLGTNAFANSTHEVGNDGDTVFSRYLVPESTVPASYQPFFSDRDQRVDYRIAFRWFPASLVRNDVSLSPVSRSNDAAVQRTGSHFMTPETAFTTHYFFAHTRNFKLTDPLLDEQTRFWQATGLAGQDKAIIEATQTRMGEADLDDLQPALISIDSAAVRVRKTLARLIYGLPVS